MEEENQVVDGIVGEFGTYEDYLDSQISATDLYYLEDEDLARQLVVCDCLKCLSINRPCFFPNHAGLNDAAPNIAGYSRAGAGLPR